VAAINAPGLGPDGLLLGLDDFAYEPVDGSLGDSDAADDPGFRRRDSLAPGDVSGEYNGDHDGALRPHTTSGESEWNRSIPRR
jgi:hypothetical protein